MSVIVLDGDTPRTRRTDPVSSHRAGDRSAANLVGVKRGVLELVRSRGPLTGAEINSYYSLANWAHPRGYPRAAHDTPRKRAAELAADGFLNNIADDGDAVYALTIKGLDTLS